MSRSLHVLIVEDCADDAELLLRELRRGGFDPIFERVETPEEMSEALDRMQWDIVISDYSLPGFIAPDALAILKGKGLELPFIIVSGAIGEEIAVEAMKAGAHDFVMKGNFTRLVPAIKRELREADLRRKHRHTEEKLRKLMMAIEHSVNMVIITDLNGIIEYVNPSFLEKTGFSREETIGDNSRILASGGTTKEMHKELWDSILAGKSWRGVYENRKKNGELYTVSTIITPVKDDDGKTTNFLAIEEDITERLKMEQELIKMQKLESLGVLAGGIAHDFNNLLMGIFANMSLAHDLSSEDSVRNKLVIAEKGTLRAKALTQQLLTFSKGGAPVKKTVSMGELVRESAEFALRGSNVACEFAIDEDLSEVEVDEGQIDRVIENLVINADQAMPEGGVIKVRAEEIFISEKTVLPLGVGNYIKISVTDQGTGIPRESLSKIFDPFFTTKKTGNGLGLASSYSIIQKHNGYIDVSSRLGEGTSFDIYLPVSKERALPPEVETKLVAIN